MLIDREPHMIVVPILKCGSFVVDCSFTCWFVFLILSQIEICDVWYILVCGKNLIQNAHIKEAGSEVIESPMVAGMIFNHVDAPRTGVDYEWSPEIHVLVHLDHDQYELVTAHRKQGQFGFHVFRFYAIVQHH